MPSPYYHRDGSTGHWYRAGLVTGAGLASHHAANVTYGPHDTNPPAVVAFSLEEIEQIRGTVFRQGYVIPWKAWEAHGKDFNRWKTAMGPAAEWFRGPL